MYRVSQYDNEIISYTNSLLSIKWEFTANDMDLSSVLTFTGNVRSQTSTKGQWSRI
jgi:hypothetical protein